MTDYTPDRVLDALIAAGWGEMARDRIPKDILASAYAGEPIRERKRAAVSCNREIPTKTGVCATCRQPFDYACWHIPRYCPPCRKVAIREKNKAGEKARLARRKEWQ